MRLPTQKEVSGNADRDHQRTRDHADHTQPGRRGGHRRAGSFHRAAQGPRRPRLVTADRLCRMYPEESLPDDRLSYILDVLALRDPWMHRVDLARATGRPLALGAHDRVVVTQVIADLGRAWAGPAVLLELTGPAGGRWALGQGDPAATVRADTVDYLRALSGRNGHPSAEADGDHAAADAVTAARVVF